MLCLGQYELRVLISDSLVIFDTITAPYRHAGFQVRDHGIQGSSGEVHFRVTKYYRAVYIALNMPYSTGLISFVMI